MAVKIVFEDQDDNEMECFLNDKGRVYIGIGQSGENIAYRGYITLDKEDVRQLIQILSDCEKDMED